MHTQYIAHQGGQLGRVRRIHVVNASTSFLYSCVKWFDNVQSWRKDKTMSVLHFFGVNCL